MTKTEILEKIDKGLRGQGNQVDIGGVLADVLTEIVNEALPTPLYIGNPDGFEGKTKAQVAETFGISEEKVEQLFRGDIQVVKVFDRYYNLQSYVDSYGDGDQSSSNYVNIVDLDSYICLTFSASLVGAERLYNFYRAEM